MLTISSKQINILDNYDLFLFIARVKISLKENLDYVNDIDDNKLFELINIIQNRFKVESENYIEDLILLYFQFDELKIAFNNNSELHDILISNLKNERLKLQEISEYLLFNN